MDGQQVAAEFAANFGALRAHPDKMIIESLTECCKRDIRAAYAVTNTIVGRLQDPATDPAFKLPILYLSDAIMKKVGGTYPEFFSKHLAAVIHRTINEVQPQDRKRLGVLVKTWEERRLLPADVIAQMSNSVAQRLALDAAMPLPMPAAVYNPMPAQSVGPLYPPQQAHQSQYTQQTHALYPHHQQQQQPPPPPPPPPHASVYPVGVYPPQASQQPSKKRTSRFDPPSSTAASSAAVATSPAFEQAVQAEMSTLLAQLLRDLGGAQFSLAELQQSDLGLYQQLRVQAEATARGRFGVQNEGVAGGAGGAKSIRAILNQTVVFLDPARVEAVLAGLSQHASASSNSDVENDESSGSNSDSKGSSSKGAGGGSKVRAIAGAIRDSLQRSLGDVNKAPPLPPILFGPLPLEPTAVFAQAIAAQRQQHNPNQQGSSSSAAVAAARRARQAIRFGPVELGRPPLDPLRKLNTDRPFRWPEDGVRFKTQIELNAYIDIYAEKRRVAMRLEQSGTIQHREWYCHLDVWVSNLKGEGADMSSDGAGGAGAAGNKKSGGGKAGAAAASGGKEFIVPADEHFTRCPVSKEEFETVWNDEEGEFMYRHAVKVLVTAAADAAVYKLGQPTSQASVRYIVAHKRLVVDEWIGAGKAATLGDAVQRYQAMSSAASRPELVQALRKAAGEGEDEEAVFVMLELAASI